MIARTLKGSLKCCWQPLRRLPAAGEGAAISHGPDATAAHSTPTGPNDLGYRVGRFILFAKLLHWRAAMLTHSDASEWWARFRQAEGR